MELGILPQKQLTDSLRACAERRGNHRRSLHSSQVVRIASTTISQAHAKILPARASRHENFSFFYIDGETCLQATYSTARLFSPLYLMHYNFLLNLQFVCMCSSATNRLITAKDVGSVQINIAHVDNNGSYTVWSCAGIQPHWLAADERHRAVFVSCLFTCKFLIIMTVLFSSMYVAKDM
jgi:hypothetical protein